MLFVWSQHASHPHKGAVSTDRFEDFLREQRRWNDRVEQKIDKLSEKVK